MTPRTKQIGVKYHFFKASLWQSQWNQNCQGQQSYAEGRHLHQGNGAGEVHNDAEIIV